MEIVRLFDLGQVVLLNQHYTESMVEGAKALRCCGLGIPAGGPRIKRIESPVSIIFTLLIASCASSPYDEPKEVNPGFSTIAIVSTEDVLSAVTSDTESHRRKEGAVAGGTAGAVGGALIGAAACAPTVYLAPLCVALAAMQGAGIGGLAGGTTGALIWGSTGLSDKDAMYLKEEVSHLDSNRDLNSDLAEALKQKLPNEILQPAAEADVQAIPLIEQISFVKTDSDRVLIHVSSGLTFAVGTGDEVTRHGYLGFSAESEERPINDWLDTNGEAITGAVDHCLDKIARKMATLILEKRSS